MRERARDFSLTRSILNTTHPGANLIAVCLLLLAGMSVGQTRKRKMDDAAVLRARLVAAFDQDFDLVKDEFKTRSVARGGGIYWLARLKPKRTGCFCLQHTYHDRHENYSHIEQ